MASMRPLFLVMVGVGVLLAAGWAAWRLSGQRTRTELDFVKLLIGIGVGVFIALVGMVLLVAVETFQVDAF